MDYVGLTGLVSLDRLEIVLSTEFHYTNIIESVALWSLIDYVLIHYGLCMEQSSTCPESNDDGCHSLIS